MSEKRLKTISDYASDLYENTEFFNSKKDAEKALKILFANIRADVEFCADVRINNFGTFKLKTRPARKGRNPKTGETIDIEEKQVITFKPSKVSK